MKVCINRKDNQVIIFKDCKDIKMDEPRKQRKYVIKYKFSKIPHPLQNVLECHKLKTYILYPCITKFPFSSEIQFNKGRLSIRKFMKWMDFLSQGYKNRTHHHN